MPQREGSSSAFAPRSVYTHDPGVVTWDFAAGDNHVRLLLGADQTAERMSFFESVLGPGFVVGAHIHREEDEYWYMLDDGMEVLLDERRTPIKGGSIVAVPAGTLHELRNVGTTPIRSIFFTMPGGLERFFAGVDALAREGAGPEAYGQLFEQTGTSVPGFPRR